MAGRLGWTRHDRQLAALDLFNQMLAVAETAVHLELLVAQGRLRVANEAGVLAYIRT